MRWARSCMLYLLVAAGTMIGCGDGHALTSGSVFVVRACRGSMGLPDGQTFRVMIRDPDVIAEAESLIGAGNEKIITGTVRPGDGGFNEPWSWHLDPSTVALVDLTIEICDGCPDHIERDVDTWIESVGAYCPWSTEIVDQVS